MISTNGKEPFSLNLGRITDCEVLECCTQEDAQPLPMEKCCLVLELTDERNALERAMLHFSHLAKETQRIGDGLYRLTLWYEQEDETELLIRVLSFGPMLKVISPENFKNRLLQRLKKQIGLRTGR